MTGAGDTLKTNEWLDNVLVSHEGYVSHAQKLYAAGHDLKDPQLSPIYGDFAGMPPAILTSGTRDLLLSSTVRTHRKLRQAGVDARLQVFEGHVARAISVQRRRARDQGGLYRDHRLLRRPSRSFKVVEAMDIRR